MRSEDSMSLACSNVTHTLMAGEVRIPARIEKQEFIAELSAIGPQQKQITITVIGAFFVLCAAIFCQAALMWRVRAERRGGGAVQGDCAADAQRL